MLKTRKFIQSFVDIVVSSFPSESASTTVVREARTFISLLLARHTYLNDPSEILELARSLTDLLYGDLVNSRAHESITARPLDIHLYTLTGLTLLELTDSEDADLVKPSQDALAKLRHALEQVSEQVQSSLQTRFDGVQPENTYHVHWAHALLRVIIVKGEIDQGRMPFHDAQNEAEFMNEPQKLEQENAINGSANANESIQVISAHQQYLIDRLANLAATKNILQTKMTVIDFSLLTSRGYLNVLADLNGF